MGINRRAPTSKKSVYTRSYPKFLGVDLSQSAGSLGKRFARAENMYRDYEAGEAEAVESIPGFRKIYSGNGKINGLSVQRTAGGETYVVVQDGKSVKRFKPNAPDKLSTLTGTELISDEESLCFNYGDYLYLFNSSSIYRISNDGELQSVSDGTSSAPYVPTVFKNGEPYEERNLATTHFIESMDLIVLSDYAYGTRGLLYRITNKERRECAVSGFTYTIPSVFIPGRAFISGEYYTVTEIENSAFSGNNYITQLTLADTVKRIGNGAFHACKSLKNVVAGDGLTEIGDSAFSSSGLEKIYIPAGFRRFGTAALPTDTAILYELGAEDFENIENKPTGPVTYGYENNDITIGYKLKTPTKTIHSVTVAGAPYTYGSTVDSNGFITEITISLHNKDSLSGAVVKILGSMWEYSSSPNDEGVDFTLLTEKSNLSFSSVIKSCTAAKTIDGRVFLWGHPRFPSVVFYSKPGFDFNSALYFGSLDYINEGNGDKNVVSVLGLPDGIAVFTSGKDNAESIYFHTPKDKNGVQKLVYPVSEVHIGDGAVGDALNFGDDPVFVSNRGLLGIGTKPLYLSKSISSRSSSIDAALNREDLSSSKLALWRGYLVLSCGGKMYLADSRATYDGTFGKEYEWFTLNGIGTYMGDGRVYRYTATAHDGYRTSRTPDAVAEGTVYSEDTGEGLVYFVHDGEEKVEVYPTEQLSGGEFYPAEKILSVDGLLIFSTGCGDICVFNNDMRGVAPKRISSAEDFDALEYSRLYGNKIHPDFYDFAGHAPRYTLETIPDDCGLPHMKKRTVAGSLAIKIKCFAGSRITSTAVYDTDNHCYLGDCDAAICDMSSFYFDSMSFAASPYTVISPDESTRAFTEKSFLLSSEGFRSPIGVYSISYRYKVD